MGERFFAFAERYRALFVDLDAAAAALSDELPEASLVLDVGGGDGAPLNHLLALRSDLRIAMLDIAGDIGGAVAPEFEHRVQRFPRTGLAEYDGPKPDAIIIAYVLHHVAIAERSAFFRNLSLMVERDGIQQVIVVEVQPGHIRSILGWLSDRYISGDRNVSLISVESAKLELKTAMPRYSVKETNLRKQDAPNYCIVAQCFEDQPLQSGR